MFIKLIILFTLLTLISCSRPEESKKFLEIQGYTYIEITGFSLLCPRGSPSGTGFIAINSHGTANEGAVCYGFSGTVLVFK